MRLGRAMLGATIGAAAFAAALAFTFPTDELVRSVVARHTPPGFPTLVFARARLRPRGVRLEEITVRRPDGVALASADWAYLRPSLRGLLRDGSGRPWRLLVGACRGEVEAALTAAGAGNALALSWRDVNLGACAPLTIAGIADGTASVRFGTPERPSGEGTIRIRTAALSLAGRLPGLDTLHADPAVVRFTLRDGRVVLDGIDLYGPEVEASGTGTLRLAGFGNLEHSAVDVALAVEPGPAATPLVRDLLTALPPADARPGAYRLALTGTLAAPRLVR